MYTGYTALLIVFLTHPGVLIPIPADGMLTWVRGIWQASWAMVMHSFSEGPKNWMASMVYWGVFLMWAYIRTALALAES